MRSKCPSPRVLGEVVVTDGVFDQENFNAIMIIQLSRALDVLYLLARHFDAEATAAILEMHEQGKLLAPPPAIDMEA